MNAHTTAVIRHSARSVWYALVFLVVGVETERGFDTMMDGLKGSITAESAQVRVAYLWSLMKR